MEIFFPRIACAARLIIFTLTNLETKLQAIDRLRETLGYRETLNRGYAVIRSGDNVITEKAKALYETNLSIEFWDGELPIKNLND